MSNTVTVSPAFTSICLNIHSTTPPTQVNHLSHFLLTLELLPSLLETASSTGDGRIIIMSSIAHKAGTLNPENMNGEQSYNRGRFYGHSKLYNVSAHFVIRWTHLRPSFQEIQHKCCSETNNVSTTGYDSVCFAKASAECGDHSVLRPPWTCKLELNKY